MPGGEVSTLFLGRIQALTSFVVSEIIEADFATDCDRTSLAEMIIYPSVVGRRTLGRYDATIYSLLPCLLSSTQCLRNSLSYYFVGCQLCKRIC